MSPSRDTLDHLLSEILTQLRVYPDGISEFELIRALGRNGVEPFEAADLGEPLSLYRTHFLLFHCLYRLQQTLHRSGEDVEIHCLRIRLRRCDPEQGALTDPDPLKSFYLDLGNRDKLSAAEVEQMLGAFWSAFKSYRGGRPLSGERRAQALAVLGLEDPVERDVIKRRYRRLAMEHHPDRGGDTAELQRINGAMELLGL